MPATQPNASYRSLLAAYLAARTVDDSISAADWQSLKLTQHQTGAIVLTPVSQSNNPMPAQTYRWDVTIKLFIREISRINFLTAAENWGFFIMDDVMRSLSLEGIAVNDSFGSRQIFKAIAPRGGYQIEASENQDSGAEGTITWQYEWMDKGKTSQSKAF